VAALRGRIFVFAKGLDGKVYVNTAANPVKPDVLGQWSPPAPTDVHMPSTDGLYHTHGAYAVNAALSYDPTSDKAKVMIYGGHAQIQDVNQDVGLHQYPLASWTWDPSSATFSDYQQFGDGVSDDPFCNHTVHLPDGRILAIGGEATHLPNISDDRGTKAAYAFDPHTEVWTKLHDMHFARWYPTAIALPDGRILVASGFDDEMVAGGQEKIRAEMEVFDPYAAAGTDPWTTLPATATRSIDIYPSLHLLPFGPDAGRVAYTGTRWAGSATPTYSPKTGIFDSVANTWAETGTYWASNRTEGTSVLLPFASTSTTAKVMVFGGGHVAPDSDPKSTLVRSYGPYPAQGWVAGPRMNYRRSNVTGVIMADGKVLLVGGQENFKRDKNIAPAFQPEIFDPDTGTFTNGAWEDMPRSYHSTALLLPDGRIFVAGGEDQTQSTRLGWDQKNYEIYSPPYLFKGGRPQITSATREVHYGFTMAANVSSARPITKFALVRPSTVTHHTNAEQRFVTLPFIQSASGAYSITLPANGGIAQPGWYMLFAIDDNGVPSVASFVHLTRMIRILPPPIVLQ
jgi:hypothetical protein